jgi:hypothetical protein
LNFLLGLPEREVPLGVFHSDEINGGENGKRNSALVVGRADPGNHSVVVVFGTLTPSMRSHRLRHGKAGPDFLPRASSARFPAQNPI